MTFLLTLLGFTFIIFIHELGHFIVARWAKVRVDIFSIGIGPRLITLFQDKKGTKYILSLLPFGGYVKLHGQEDMPGKKITTKNSDSFQAKPPSKRLAIMLGGVTMNLISAYIFIVISYMIGIRFTTNQVGMVYPNSPAEKAGLQTKDFITAVNGKSTQTFEDVFVQSALSNKKNPLEIEILRNDEKKTLNVVWQGENIKEQIKMLGIQAYPLVTVGKLSDDSYYYQQGFREGMKILDVVLSEENDTKSLESSINNAKSGIAFLEFIQKNPKVLIDVSVLENGNLRIMKSVRTYSKKMNKKGFLFSARIQTIKNQPANLAGLQDGDVIRSIGEKQIRGFEEIGDYLDKLKRNRKLSISFLRNGKLKKVSVKPKRNEIKDSYFLGIMPFKQKDGFGKIGWISKEMQDQVPGLRVGDFLLDIKEDPEKNMAVKVLREELELKFNYSKKNFPKTEVGTIFPISLGEKKIKLPLYQAIVQSFTLAYRELQEVYLFIYQMINGNISADNAGGPIAIFETSSEVFNARGFAYFLLLFAKISISLAVTNLLPIPMLDGGHTVFILYEIIRKKPAPEKFVHVMHVLGFALLLFLFIFINMNDIQRILSR